MVMCTAFLLRDWLVLGSLHQYKYLRVLLAHSKKLTLCGMMVEVVVVVAAGVVEM